MPTFLMFLKIRANIYQIEFVLSTGIKLHLHVLIIFFFYLHSYYVRWKVLLSAWKRIWFSSRGNNVWLSVLANECQDVFSVFFNN